MTTGIEWTNETWNPVVGCSKVSEGCRNCYAMDMARRIAAAADAKGGGQTERQRAYQRVVKRRGGPVGDPGTGVPLPQWNNRVECIDSALTIPLGWRAPRKVFVNSMGDLFHEDVPFAFIDRVWAVMALTPRHTYQILTKRPERMAEYLLWAEARREIPRDRVDAIAMAIEGMESAGFATKSLNVAAIRSCLLLPLPNVWLGTSCENQAAADERIPHLLRCPAAVRFLSCEPLLGGIDLFDPRRGPIIGGMPQVDWVIVGGESHRSPDKARACDVAWIRSIVKQCRDAGVACFVKQLGSRPFVYNDQEEDVLRCKACGHVDDDQNFDVLGADDGNVFCNQCSTEQEPRYWTSDKKGGDPSEWPEDLRVQEFPAVVGAGT